jgi:hypothetical protein
VHGAETMLSAAIDDAAGRARRPGSRATPSHLPLHQVRSDARLLDEERKLLTHGPEQRKLCEAIGEFGGYLRANAASIPNYGERYGPWSSRAEPQGSQVRHPAWGPGCRRRRRRSSCWAIRIRR